MISPALVLSTLLAVAAVPQQPAPPVVLREDFREVAAHVPAVAGDLCCEFLGFELHGPGRDQVKLSFHPEVENDPHYLWNGLCPGPVLIAFPFARPLDLSAADGLVRLRSKIVGASTLHCAVQVEDSWFALAEGIGGDADWTTHTVALHGARWRRLDCAAAQPGPVVDGVDLSAVTALGFVAPRRGGQSRDCVRLDWFEVASSSARLAPEAGATSAAGGRPNVLVILLDDAGYHDFGFMGSTEIPTPNIDALAASGMTFSDAHLSGTTCSPSRAGIMTGRYQQRFGHHNNVPSHGHGMDPSERTVGDAFRAGGFETCYVGKWHLGAVERYWPTRRGFDAFHGLLEGSRSYWPDAVQDAPDNDRAIRHGEQVVRWEGYLTDHFTAAALAWLDRPREKPFFMILSYTAPHTPMHARPEHLAKFAGHPRPKLAAMLWAADEGIGQVLGKLDERGLRENTLVFFLSDNGGSEHNRSDNSPLKGYKGTKFEGGQRTPFVMSWPARIPAGSSFGGLVSALDIYPTAAAACGVDSTKGKPLDGVDLLPYVLGEREGDPHDVLFWHRSVEDAVRAGDHKLVGHEAHGFRLYDLSQDIGETRDLAPDEPARVQLMLADLRAWKAGLGAPQWRESAAWAEVKVELYRAWLNNEQPRYSDPGAMKRYRQAAGR